MPYNQLSKEEADVILNKGTELPFTGEYDNFYLPGVYVCRRCNLPLFTSKSKFDAHCGWPAFDENYPNALQRIRDEDGVRVEIQCSNCGAHLGHVFEGEGFTEKDTRHCVNSVSIVWIEEGKKLPTVLSQN